MRQRGSAEGAGGRAFHAAVLLFIVALVDGGPYRSFHRTRRLSTVARLVLVCHAGVLTGANPYPWQDTWDGRLLPLLAPEQRAFPQDGAFFGHVFNLEAWSMGSEAPGRSTPRKRAWPMTRWVERQAGLFGRMMERVGADPGATAQTRFEGGFAAACRRCLACQSSTDCERWLEAGGGDAAPSFCANAAFLNRVRTCGAG